MRFEVATLTYDEIIGQGRPQLPNQPEAFQAVLFDTLAYPTAAPAVPLTFYQQNAQQDPTITNVSNGSLPSGYNFRIQALNLDLLMEPSFLGNVGTGTLTDIARFLKTNRATIEFTINNKQYYPIPATYPHASGGETGFVAASYTAPQSYQFGNNGIFDGGFETDGAQWILDKQPFSVRLFFQPAATALSQNIMVRMNMRGTLYRPVQ